MRPFGVMMVPMESFAGQALSARQAQRWVHRYCVWHGEPRDLSGWRPPQRPSGILRLAVGCRLSRLALDQRRPKPAADSPRRTPSRSKSAWPNRGKRFSRESPKSSLAQRILRIQPPWQSNPPTSTTDEIEIVDADIEIRACPASSAQGQITARNGPKSGGNEPVRRFGQEGASHTRRLANAV